MVDCAVIGADGHASVHFEVVAVDACVAGIAHEHERIHSVIALQSVKFDAPHAMELGAAGDADVCDRARRLLYGVSELGGNTCIRRVFN